MRSRTGFGEQTPPAIFSLILGLFGLSMAWGAAARMSIVPAAISEIILGGVAVVFAIAAVAYGRKLTLRASTLIEDARILPNRGGLAALAVCVSVLAAGLVPISPVWATRVMYVALGLHVLMALLVIYVLVSGPKEQRQVTPLWHLSFVGFIVAAVSAVNLGKYELAEAIFWATLVAAVIIWAVSAVQLVKRVPPAPLRPMLAIHLAPASLFVTVALGFPADDFPTMVMMARVFSIVAMLILLGLLVSLKSLLEAGFSPMWASFTFPMTAFSAAMLSYAGQIDSVLERILGGVMLAVASVVVPYIAVKVIRMWMTGQLALKTNAAKA
jgi:tellurite resistance protein